MPCPLAADPGAGAKASTSGRAPSARKAPARRTLSIALSARALITIPRVQQNVSAHVSSDPHASTYQYLLHQYGPLLTLRHLAEVMHTTPAGLRMALSRRGHPFAVALAGSRRRLGRRVYFEAHTVAGLIDGVGPEPAPGAERWPAPARVARGHPGR